MLDSSEPKHGQIGPYRIVARLGSGGMGEVYRATDTRLGREVAIKVLLAEVASDPERIGRFRREARVAASLNHPNIAAIYGFEDVEEKHFLVMELVEGRSLADRLKAGPLPIDEGLGIVEQIAAGLEAAHDAGIVHRDLKPSNIVLTPDGKAKILDFGVAKAMDEERQAQQLEPSPTLSVNLTAPGMMVGTVPYMSPEQARGRLVDKRTDIWSLGCLLYECLTGRRAFDGETSTDVLAKIIERDPSWDALPSRTPPRVRELVQRCLEKDVKRRIRDAGDVRIELERARENREWASSGAVRAAGPGRRWSSYLPWSIAGLAVAIAIAAMAFSPWEGSRSSGTSRYVAQRTTPGIPLRLDVTDPDVPRYPGSDTASVAIANDGQSVAYVGTAPGGVWWESEICLRRADEVHVTQRVGPPAKGYGVSNPFFSPDGQWLGFTGTGLYKVSLSGGGRTIPIVENLSPGGVKGAVWMDRGIVYSPAAKAGLFLVGEDGGVPELLTVPDASKGEVSHRWPAALPDGRHVLFTIKKEGITSFDQAEIALLDLESKSWTTIIRGGSFGRYLPTGHIAYARSGSIAAVPYDLRSSEVTGPPFTVLSNVMTEPGSGAAQFAVAADAGALAYVPGGPNIHREEFVWLDRHGTTTTVGAPLQPYYDSKLSPDGSRIAATSFGATDTVVVYDIARGSSLSAKTEGNTSLISWHPDGRQLLVSSDREGGEQRLYLAAADGTGAMRRVPLDVPGMEARLLVKTPDGVELIYRDDGRLYLARIDGGSSPRRLSGPAELNVTRPSLSPDGRWLAYDSEVAGRREVFVRPFPSGNGTWQISRGGGVAPRWSPRGDEILYQRDNGSTDRWLMSARLTPTPSAISAAAPVELAKLPSGLQLSGFHADGQRLLAIRPVAPEYAGDRVIEIVNWLEQVQAKAPGR